MILQPRTWLPALLVLLACRSFDNIYDPANNRPPIAPGNPAPASGSTELDTLGQVLRWECADPDSIAGDFLVYDVFFGTGSQPGLVDSNRTVRQYETGRLAVGGMYYWRVIARDTRGDSAVGEVWSFSTDDNLAPGTPGSPQPGDSVTSRAPGQTLFWQAQDPNPGDSLVYDLYFGTSPSPGILVRSLAVPGFRPTGQAHGARYYWRVVARDRDSAETSGPVWWFETMEAVDITSPVPGQRWRAGTSHDITWSGGADGQGSQKSDVRVMRSEGRGRRPGRRREDGGTSAVPSGGGPMPLAADSTVVLYSTDNGGSWTRAGRATEPNRFDWALPVTEVPQARVRVRVHSGADTVVATSGSFEIYQLPPSINVTTPSAGTQWRIGDYETITWAGGSDGSDSVVVYLSGDGGRTWTREGRATQPGSFPWAVAGPETDSALVEVRSYVAAESVSGRSDRFEVFQLDSVTVTSPTDSSRYRWYSYATFTWTGGSPSSDSTIVFFRRVETDPWTRLGRQTAHGRFENWLWPAIEPSEECRVRVVAHRYGLVEEGLSPEFEIYDDSQPTTPTITSPAGGEQWSIGSSQVVTWIGGTDGMDSTVVLYSTNNGNQWLRQGVVKQPGRFEWTVPGPATSLARVGLVAWCMTRQAQAISEQFSIVQP